MFTRILAVATFVALPALVVADDAGLDLPSFRHLQDKAIECVDITIGRWPIGLAAALIPDDEADAEATAMKEVLRGLKSVRVRSYKFSADNGYSKRDIEAVRRQLRAPQWSQLAQVRNRRQEADVDIYVSIEHDLPTGLAIVATGAREFTIINIVGRVDPKHLGRLGASLDLPILASESHVRDDDE